MRAILTSTIATFLLALSLPAQADTLLLEKVQQDAQRRAEMPTRGMSMATVADRFGEPKNRIAAVGEPPIARWVYDGYVVYFEKSLVLHAVANP